MPKGQFYALAIFIMDRLDTKGVGLKSHRVGSELARKTTPWL